MAELLRKYNELTFSGPDQDLNMDKLFSLEVRKENGEKEDDNEKEADKEKEDNREKDEDRQEDEEEDVMSGGGQEDESRPPPVTPSRPTLTNVAFYYMDIVAAIEQLSLCLGPRPDGNSDILLKKAKISSAQMLRNIFQHSLDNSEIQKILKLGFICPTKL